MDWTLFVRSPRVYRFKNADRVQVVSRSEGFRIVLGIESAVNHLHVSHISLSCLFFKEEKTDLDYMNVKPTSPEATD